MRDGHMKRAGQHFVLRRRSRTCRSVGFWEDDGGFSTLGMVIALGLSLVLVFSGFRVYRVQTVSADIQDVADVAALAAENQVAVFVSVARICDAAVLSFSLAGIVVGLIGVAALCVPAERLLSWKPPPGPG